MDADPEGEDVTYILEPDDVADGFPALAFRAQYRIRFGVTLELDLTIENTGTDDFIFEEALHAYLAVGDIGQVAIEGLDGATYIDQALGGVEAEQQGDVVFHAETDRIYRSTGEVTVVDPFMARRIVVTRRGSADVVIWNPWLDKGSALADLGDGQWRHFVCVEGANTRDAAITLAPGERHSLGYSLRDC
jgi:glucose-6-phosphate 1-epimerase